MSVAEAESTIPTSQTNGVIEEYDEDEKLKMRPADIDADMREMERRKRVELIMNSRLFREELERIIESQMKDGNSSAGLLQQISDMVGSKYSANNHLLRGSSCVTPINDIRGVEAMGYAKGEKILRCKLAALFRIMDLHGWTKGIYNQITARLSQQEELFLVNPYGLLYSEITASSLVKVDMQGCAIEVGTTNFPTNAAGFQLHAAIYAARPDLKCIVHLRTASVQAVSALKERLLPLSEESAVVGEVSHHQFGGAPTDAEHKDRLVRDLGPINKVMFLTNHGAVCCGQTVEEAFFNVYNTINACETQLKVMPLGKESMVLLTDEARRYFYEEARKLPETLAPPQSGALTGATAAAVAEKRFRLGAFEFEALMRTLDNAGFRTGYVYRQPLIKGDPPRPRNDVEVPPAVSSLGYLFEEEEMYKQGQWKKQYGGKGNDRIRWLNSPNVYQKVEILETGTTDPKKITKWVGATDEEWVADSSPSHTSTPLKIDNALQFVPKNTNPKEFKKMQQLIKENRRADKITSGPQSHILEGVSWEEAKKMQDANMSGTSDQVILVGAASKGIIQREFQHNATVYKTPYAKNPFDAVTDEEIETYKKDITRKQRGDSYYDEDESDAFSSSLPPSGRYHGGITSETEDESFAQEGQVIMIQTSTAPKASQAEVVLSDVDVAPQTTELHDPISNNNGLKKGFDCPLMLVTVTSWEQKKYTALIIQLPPIVRDPSPIAYRKMKSRQISEELKTRFRECRQFKRRTWSLERPDLQFARAIEVNVVDKYLPMLEFPYTCKLPVCDEPGAEAHDVSGLLNSGVEEHVLDAESMKQSFIDSSELETIHELPSLLKSASMQSIHDFSSVASTEDEEEPLNTGECRRSSIHSIISCIGTDYEEPKSPRVDCSEAEANELATSFTTSEDTSCDDVTVIPCPKFAEKEPGETCTDNSDESEGDIIVSSDDDSSLSNSYASLMDVDYFEPEDMTKFRIELPVIHEDMEITTGNVETPLEEITTSFMGESTQSSKTVQLPTIEEEVDTDLGAQILPTACTDFTSNCVTSLEVNNCLSSASVLLNHSSNWQSSRSHEYSTSTVQIDVGEQFSLNNSTKCSLCSNNRNVVNNLSVNEDVSPLDDNCECSSSADKIMKHVNKWLAARSSDNSSSSSSQTDAENRCTGTWTTEKSLVFESLDDATYVKGESELSDDGTKCSLSDILSIDSWMSADDVNKPLINVNYSVECYVDDKHKNVEKCERYLSVNCDDNLENQCYLDDEHKNMEKCERYLSVNYDNNLENESKENDPDDENLTKNTKCENCKERKVERCFDLPLEEDAEIQFNSINETVYYDMQNCTNDSFHSITEMTSLTEQHVDMFTLNQTELQTVESQSLDVAVEHEVVLNDEENNVTGTIKSCEDELNKLDGDTVDKIPDVEMCSNDTTENDRLLKDHIDNFIVDHTADRQTADTSLSQNIADEQLDKKVEKSILEDIEDKIRDIMYDCQNFKCDYITDATDTYEGESTNAEVSLNVVHGNGKSVDTVAEVVVKIPDASVAEEYRKCDTINYVTNEKSSQIVEQHIDSLTTDCTAYGEHIVTSQYVAAEHPFTEEHSTFETCVTSDDTMCHIMHDFAISPIKEKDLNQMCMDCNHLIDTIYANKVKAFDASSFIDTYEMVEEIKEVFNPDCIAIKKEMDAECSTNDIVRITENCSLTEKELIDSLTPEVDDDIAVVTYSTDTQLEISDVNLCFNDAYSDATLQTNQFNRNMNILSVNENETSNGKTFDASEYQNTEIETDFELVEAFVNDVAVIDNSDNGNAVVENNEIFADSIVMEEIKLLTGDIKKGLENFAVELESATELSANNDFSGFNVLDNLETGEEPSMLDHAEMENLTVDTSAVTNTNRNLAENDANLEKNEILTVQILTEENKLMRGCENIADELSSIPDRERMNILELPANDGFTRIDGSDGHKTREEPNSSKADVEKRLETFAEQLGSAVSDRQWLSMFKLQTNDDSDIFGVSDYQEILEEPNLSTMDSTKMKMLNVDVNEEVVINTSIAQDNEKVGSDEMMDVSAGNITVSNSAAGYDKSALPENNDFTEVKHELKEELSKLDTTKMEMLDMDVSAENIIVSNLAESYNQLESYLNANFAGVNHELEEELSKLDTTKKEMLNMNVSAGNIIVSNLAESYNKLESPVNDNFDGVNHEQEEKLSKLDTTKMEMLDMDVSAENIIVSNLAESYNELESYVNANFAGVNQELEEELSKLDTSKMEMLDMDVRAANIIVSNLDEADKLELPANDDFAGLNHELEEDLEMLDMDVSAGSIIVSSSAEGCNKLKNVEMEANRIVMEENQLQIDNIKDGLGDTAEIFKSLIVDEDRLKLLELSANVSSGTDVFDNPEISDDLNILEQKDVSINEIFLDLHNLENTDMSVDNDFSKDVQPEQGMDTNFPKHITPSCHLMHMEEEGCDTSKEVIVDEETQAFEHQSDSIHNANDAVESTNYACKEDVDCTSGNEKEQRHTSSSPATETVNEVDSIRTETYDSQFSKASTQRADDVRETTERNDGITIFQLKVSIQCEGFSSVRDRSENSSFETDSLDSSSKSADASLDFKTNYPKFIAYEYFTPKKGKYRRPLKIAVDTDGKDEKRTVKLGSKYDRYTCRTYSPRCRNKDHVKDVDPECNKSDSRARASEWHRSVKESKFKRDRAESKAAASWLHKRDDNLDKYRKAFGSAVSASRYHSKRNEVKEQMPANKSDNNLSKGLKCVKKVVDANLSQHQDKEQKNEWCTPKTRLSKPDQSGGYVRFQDVTESPSRFYTVNLEQQDMLSPVVSVKDEFGTSTPQSKYLDSIDVIDKSPLPALSPIVSSLEEFELIEAKLGVRIVDE